MLDNLNEMQKEAVIYKDGPLLILAGAGSGKTKVLTCRIAYLIKEYGVDPYNILAITFTNKAATEMKDRITNLIGKTNITASTFHSFGVKILREYDNAEILGYNKNFNIMDSDDTLTLIKKITKDLGFDPKTFSPYMIKNKISSCKNEYVMPEDYKAFVCSSEDDVIYKVYSKYEDTLKQNNSVDFDDLLILPIKLFKEYPDVLKYYQDKYKYVLIDEYQDTNEAQYIFSKMLCNNHKNIFVVGDNDQAIYAFRGANYKNILNFEKDYPDCKVIMLEENYRSTQNILDAANSVIRHNKMRKDKNLWCNNDVGDKVKYIKCESDKEECSFVTDKIKELRDKYNVNYEDIAILYRTNAQSRLIEEEMLKNGIPYRIVGSFYFYNRKEIKDLLCYLRIINNPDDDVSLLRVINTPKRGIGDKTIEALSKVANDKGISLFEAIDSGKELGFKNLILEMKEKCESLTLTEMVEMVLKLSGLRDELSSDKSLESEIRLENLEEFKSITKGYEEEYGVISLTDFLNEVSLVSDISEHQDSSNKVSLMTIHAVKGLEFDNVFIVGMEEGIFPHYNSINEGTMAAIEEERRLCYVAITRAKKNLWMLNCKRRMLFGNTQINMPSRFMEEIDPKYIECENNRVSLVSKASNFVKGNMFRQEDVSYQVGDHVKHEEFGEGVVVACDKSLVTIAFPHPFGIKKMMAKHKSISKVE